MSETLIPERGRFLLDWRTVLNRHAKLVGQKPFLPPKRWYQIRRWFKPDEPLIQRSFQGPQLEWGGLCLPWTEVTHQFLVVGSPGSGKSLLILLAMQGALRQVAQLPDHRAFIYDAKNELLPRLVAMGHNPTLFNPFDTRSVAWAIRTDVRNAAQAAQVAAALIPMPEGGKDSFWVQSSRLVLAAIMTAFSILSSNTWTLRDVLLTLRSSGRIEELLKQVPETSHIWENIRGDGKTESNLIASLLSSMQRYEVVASLMEKATEEFSIRQWAKDSGGILLVPNLRRYSEVLTPFHRLFIQMISDETLSLPDSTSRRTFLFLDELRNLGRIQCLFALINEGRSRGIVTVAGTQSLEGIQAVYGEKEGQEILGQFRSKIFLRNDSHITANWISEHIGKVTHYVVSRSRTTSYGKDGSTSTTVSYSRRTEPLILPSEIMSMPVPEPGGWFYLINDLPSVGGVYTCHYTFEYLVGAVPPADPKVPNLVEFESAEMQLFEWNKGDFKRLSEGGLL
jgi:hypothetical protein